jgi:signal transduction histidine kinase
LAIANKIIETHGGRIEARNRDEGGAEFSVVLPLRSAQVGEQVKELAAVAGSR